MKTMKTKPRLEWKDALMTTAFHVNETTYILMGHDRKMPGDPSDPSIPRSLQHPYKIDMLLEQGEIAI